MDTGSHWKISSKKYSCCCEDKWMVEEQSEKQRDDFEGCYDIPVHWHWKLTVVLLETVVCRPECSSELPGDWCSFLSFPPPGVWANISGMGPKNCPTSSQMILMLTLQWTKMLTIQIKGERLRLYLTVAVVELANELNLGSGKREESTPRILGNLGSAFHWNEVLRKEQFLMVWK